MEVGKEWASHLEEVKTDEDVKPAYGVMHREGFSSLSNSRAGLCRKGSHLSYDSKANNNVFGWDDINVSVPSRRGGPAVTLLHGISGTATSGQMVALVGPSGAGKSTFLDVLSFRKTVGTITGSRTVNGRPLSQSYVQSMCSYATQEDTFHPTQTVLEAVLFQAMMRLGVHVPHNKKVYMAKQLIVLAGLEEKEEYRIGGMLPGGLLVRGLSGGEKRRLSLCCATITHPDVLFADEPTSGLDSMAALVIMQLLRAFSDTGMIIFCTIHQPRQAIWSLFDRVLVLAKGYQLFYGTPLHAEKWFTSQLGIACPHDTSPSDFIMDQVNIDFDKSNFYGKNGLNNVQDLALMAASFQKSNPNMAMSIITIKDHHEEATALAPYDRTKLPDFLFLAHSDGFSATFQYFFPKENCDTPYITPWWMWLFLPVMAITHLCVAPLYKRLGLKPFVVMDRYNFYIEGRDEPIRVETLATLFLAVQYLPRSGYLKCIKESINDVVRYADRKGIKYLGLGGFNKAEWVNRGGDDVIPETNPQVTRVSHGNTMTAAAVVTNVIQICGAKGLRNQVLLTGSTSKVGQAVALYLAHHGFEVVCYTKSDQRFAELKQRFSPNSRGGKLVRADEFAQGSAVRLWIIGKWQPQVHDHIPHKGEVVVFSVPDPMDPGRRPDLNITDGAVFEMDRGSYTTRKNGLNLTSPYLYACNTGALVHAAMNWDHHETGPVDWTKLDDYLSAAYSLRLRLPPLGKDITPRQRPRWMFTYITLLQRNFRAYVRNLGNVVARLSVAATVSTIVSLVFHNVGKTSNLSQLNDVLGSMFNHLFVLSLLPIASQSSFLYDRQFFQRENAAGLYPCSAYYAANMTLELLFNTINAMIYAIVTYSLIDYQSFVQAPDPFLSFLRYMGIMILLNITANAQVVAVSFMSPNQEVAFVLAAGYSAVAIITAGVFVTIPQMWAPVSWLQYISILKYPYQACILNFFKDNPTIEPIIHQLQLDVPSTVAANVGITVLLYFIFLVWGFVFLKYLYKERR